MHIKTFQKLPLELNPDNLGCTHGMGKTLYTNGKSPGGIPYISKLEDLYIARVYDSLYQGVTYFSNNWNYWRYSYQW